MDSPLPDPAASAMFSEARKESRPSTSFHKALVSSILVLLFLLLGAATMWLGLSRSPLPQSETVARKAPPGGETAFWRQAHAQKWGSAASGGKATSTAATSRKLKSTLQVFEQSPPAATKVLQQSGSPGKPSISILTIQADSRVWFKRSPSPPRGLQQPLQVIMGASLHVVPSGPNPLHN